VTTEPATDRPAGMQARRLAATLWVVGGVMSLVLVLLGAPPPMSDDAWFKGAAAHMASTGVLANPGLTGFFPRVHEVYACYPPIPLWLLAWFYAVFGVTQRASIAFTLTVHTLSAMAIGLAALRIQGGFRIPARVAWWTALATGVVWLGAERLLDRPEEFGLLFVWLDLGIRGPRHRLARAALSGLLAGLAALSAPWAGLVAMALFSFRTLGASWRTHQGTAVVGALLGPVGVATVTSLTVFGAWVVSLELAHPGVFAEQFLGAMQAAQVFEPYPEDVPSYLAAVLRAVGAQRSLLFAFAVVLLWFPVALTSLPRADRDEGAVLASALYTAGLVTLGIGLAFRPLAYTYTWGSIELLMPCLAVAFARFQVDPESRLFGRALMAVVVATAWILGPVRSATYAWLDDPEARVDGAFAGLREVIPPGERVAVTSVHWMAFQGRNPWRDALFLSKRDLSTLDDCDWLVLRAADPPDDPPYFDDFEPVASHPSWVPATMSYAWTVLRRRPAGEDAP